MNRPLTIDDVLGPTGLACHAHAAWESRTQQLTMANAIADAIAKSSSLIVEAPTGVGKTLAYLTPALLANKRVVISTNTKTLQEQIADKDIPLLARILAHGGLTLSESSDTLLTSPAPNERRFAVMKGRSNYLCLDRLDRRRRQQTFRFAEPDVVDRIARWSGQTHRGDRSELPWLAEDDPIWSSLDARSEICVGRKCGRYDECFVVRLRARAANADLIIVNHHLLLADLALKAAAALSNDGAAFGAIIPAADILIVDEAHALEDVASDHFGGTVSLRKVDRLGNDGAAWTAWTGGSTQIDAMVTRAVSASRAVFDALPSTGDGRMRIDGGASFDEARRAVPEAVAMLDGVAGVIESTASDAAGGSIARRARDISASLSFVLGSSDTDYVYWMERSKSAASLGAAPIEVGPLLSDHLFGVFSTVVMTSATLATRKDAGFSYFAERIGAPATATTICLDTPFDYKRQVALYLPPSLPSPEQPGHFDALCETGRQLIDMVGGGAFFLFTSRRMMMRACARLRNQLDYPVLMQGEAPKRALLETFVASAPAVLFATASFWEGVDVPGDPLRMVLIDRLPFAVPDDPLVAARCARIESRNKSAFATYQVPQAILRLKQGFGRLVRTKQDKGVVVLLDPRVRSKSYGQRFLTALPDAQRISDPGHLAHWLKAGADEC